MASVQEFYSGRSVFLTGASGFLGKQILEKLLRSCDVKDVYVLVRPKKGKTSQERKDQLLKTKLFSHLKVYRPNYASQVNLIPGDMMAPRMGISDADLELLQKNISIVIHSAASVNFQEKIRDAVRSNVVALQEMITVVKTLPKLESFVHISTAYVNCHEKFSVEEIIKPKQDPYTIIDMINHADDKTLEAAAPTLIKPWPNTYTFTKSLAEWILKEQCSDLPVAVFRPSIIGATAMEPVRGWIDNFNAATGVLAGSGSGLIRTVYGGGPLVADVVPVDLCANAVIAIGWSTAIERPSSIPIYNFTSGTLNPVRWEDFRYWVKHYFNDHPLMANSGVTVCRFTNSRLILWLSQYGEERVMMMLGDLMLRLKGKKPMMVKLHQRAMNSSSVLEFFTCNEWKFEAKNIPAFIDKLSAEDRLKFNFDIKSVHWPEYLVHYGRGIKEFALKEDMSIEGFNQARRRMNSLEWIVRFYKFSLTSLILVLIWSQLRNRVSAGAVMGYLLLAVRKLAEFKNKL